MHLRIGVATTLAFLTTLSAAFAQGTNAPPAQPSTAPSTQPPAQPPAQPTAQAPTKPNDLRALDGEWTFMEDRTEGRALEQLGPPMASKFSLRVEDGPGGSAVILNGHGSGHKDVRVALDGSTTDITEPNTISHYRGSWKDGKFEYTVTFERTGGAPGGIGQIRRSFRMTPDGLLVSVEADARGESIALYRHAQDIPMPTPAKATINDLAWLAGAWTGSRGTDFSISMEERWTPPLGGAMLAVSRTVRNNKMGAFEYLRIVEREGSLVYIAQPNGAKGTEFVLSEITPTRAVFENPRHDYPNRIVYELRPDGGLTASIGQLKGGTPRRFIYKREAQPKSPN